MAPSARPNGLGLDVKDEDESYCGKQKADRKVGDRSRHCPETLGSDALVTPL